MTLTQPAAMRIAKLANVITEVDHLCAVEHPHNKQQRAMVWEQAATAEVSAVAGSTIGSQCIHWRRSYYSQ